MKKFIFCLICLFIFTPFTVQADNGYEITDYHVNIKVNENNTFNIKETITANFNIPKHGIVRYIPMRNEVARVDGTKYVNWAKIDNINVDNTFDVYNENGQKVIQIGDEDKTLTGTHTYNISYTYSNSKDNTSDYDELYFNLIGNQWDTSISNVTFEITMPKEFDASTLGFSTGEYGKAGTDDIYYAVNGNVIMGAYNNTLLANEGLTVRLELPEGYFVNDVYSFNIINFICLIIPIIFLLISIFLWYKFGRDNQVVPTVEFYPPEGFNSLEIGFLYKGNADNIDVISLLIYLANKGYIKITETEEKSLFFKTKGFKIIKVKDYDGDNVNERIFMDGLFDSHTNIFNKDNSSRDEVTSTDLENSFYLTVNKIIRNINNKENKSKIFEKSASSKTIFIILMLIMTFCLITIPPFLEYGDQGTLLFALIFPGIGFIFMFYMLFGGAKTIYVNGKPTRSSIGTKVFGLFWGLLFGGIPWLLLVFPTLLQNNFYLIIYIVGILCVLGMVICLKYLPKRTKYGNDILGKISGFKNFLETAEKGKLEALVMEKPTYFYDILPYTYVLGVSDKWIKQFENIAIEPPTWYYGSSAFDYVVFSSFMNSTVSATTSAMTSSPSSSSGGGGFSGGGSGGGGGGSW